MIDVQLRPGVSGCVTVPLGCMTLGLFPLLRKMGERHFILRMDDDGVETRAAPNSMGRISAHAARSGQDGQRHWRRPL